MLEKSVTNQKKGFVDRFLGVVIEPSSTFKYVVSRPDFVIPLLIVLLIGLIGIPVSEIAIKQAMDSLPADIDPSVLLTFSPIVLLIQGIVVLLITMLFRAAIFSAIATLFSAKVNFKASFAIAGYLNFPSLVAQLVAYITMKMNGAISNLSLNFFLSSEKMTSRLGLFLGNITPFTIWYVVLSTLALSHLYSTSKKRAFIVTIIMWSLVAGISILFAS